jgi:hypothetical protein
MPTATVIEPDPVALSLARAAEARARLAV